MSDANSEKEKDVFDGAPKTRRKWLSGKKQENLRTELNVSLSAKRKAISDTIKKSNKKAKQKEKEEQSEAISILVGAGIPQKTIARILKISPTYLTKHFQGELDDGGHEATAKIAKVLYKSAMAGNINAITLWLKSRAQWRDTSDKLEVTVEAAQLSEVERSQRLMAIMMKNPEFSEGMRQKRLVAQNQAAIDITPTSTLKGEEHEENGED